MRRGKDTADHEKGGKKRRRASEKQNMLCTEDESMIKNVSRGGGAGEGEGSRGLKGKQRGNQSSRTKFNGGLWKIDFQWKERGGGRGVRERKWGSLEYSRTSWEGFGKFHFITLSF